ncbi:hypothetical protein MRX96_007730 [Rhipicephalus microplus]
MTAGMNAIEYVLFSVLVVGNLSVGLYFSLRKHGRNTGPTSAALEVFLGSRTLTMLPLAASTVASILSSTGLVAIPAHYYAYGWHLMWVGIMPLFLLPLATHVFVPVIYKLGVDIDLRVHLFAIQQCNICQRMRHLPHFDAKCRRYRYIRSIFGSPNSTTSSMINSQAAILYVDVIFPRWKNANQHVLCITRCTALALGIIMTVYSTICVYMGSLSRVFLMVYSGLTSPFVGLCLLAMLFPFVHSKGAAVATIVTVVFQLWHITKAIQTGAAPPRMPVSLDYCPGNVTLHTAVLDTFDSNRSSVAAGYG